MFRPRSSKASVSLYVSLGVTQIASQDDIHRAYKLLHIKYKQDVTEKKTGAKTKLKEVEKAYSILGDPSKRAMYDKHGTVRWWTKIQQAFSPEAIDKQSQLMKGLWTFCFTATGCCFCYCCHHCCNTCKPPTCDHDDDEVYIRANFPAEYLTQGSTSTPFFRRRQLMEIKQAARRRRRDMYIKKGQGKTEGNREQNEQECEVKHDDSNEKTEGNNHPMKRTKRSLISKDSGYDFGLDNNGYVNDLDGVSINDSEGFSEGIELDQASIDVHGIENQGNPDSEEIELDQASIDVHSIENQGNPDSEEIELDQASIDVHGIENQGNPDSEEIELDQASIDVHGIENQGNPDSEEIELDQASIDVHGIENQGNSDSEEIEL